MGKVHIIFILISSLMLIANSQGFQNMFHGSEKIAKFRVYLHDALGGPNQNVYEVARANITSTSPTFFGQVRVVDIPITVEPDISSKKLGRAQGLVSPTGMEESALTMNLNFVFTGGEYKGSTLCIVGSNPFSKTNRELPVVGGSGVFRWARGYSISNNYSYDPVAEYGILEYNLYVVYLE